MSVVNYVMLIYFAYYLIPNPFVRIDSSRAVNLA